MNELSRQNENLPVSREVWSAAWIAVCVIGVPVVLTMFTLLVFHAFGMAWTEVSWAAFCLVAFLSNFVLLPLAASLAVRNRERKREIAEEMMAFFSHKVTTLYALAGEDPALSADSRMAEVFEIYSRADREVEENVQNPLFARETIERGVSLADEILEYRNRP
ncbi:hypothetical protein BH24ACT21_BH24ACT21_14250 [soil metagenome]